ncbi:hypothetical protein G6F59_014086 [Rhizopus arrhizus]|nr:hypothetical protein G6F59_014086 [Rhizopus arrhizus]
MAWTSCVVWRPEYRQGRGKTLFITGGSRGIGLAIALRAARDGANVAIAAKSSVPNPKLPGTIHSAAEAVTAAGGQGLALKCDIREEEQVQAAVAATVDTFGGIDILVNNAAFQLHCERLEDLEDAHLQETLQTNIGGYIQMARAVLPHLGEGASIINTGSETGLFGSKALIDYSATKGAIHAFTKALARELGPRGVRANCVAPGIIEPDMTLGKFGENWEQELKQGIPLQRFGLPADVAQAILFLASDLSSYSTGIVVDVNGGFHIH